MGQGTGRLTFEDQELGKGLLEGGRDRRREAVDTEGA